MSISKTYNIGDSVLRLAPITAQRVNDFAKLIGKEDLFDLSNSIEVDSEREKIGKGILKVVLKPEDITKAMHICLDDTDSAVDCIAWENIPIKKTKEIVLDFFAEVAANLQ